MREPTTKADDQPPETFEPRSEPVFNLPAVVIALIALCTLVHLLGAYVLSDEQDFGLLLRAAFIPVRYTLALDLGGLVSPVYAFTSPVTYSLLHGSFVHLAINMVWLAAFGSPLANRLGAPRFLLFWMFTAACAAFLHYLLHMMDQAPLVGASGAISGMMGAAARFGFHVDRHSGKPAFLGAPMPVMAVFASRAAVTFLAVWMVVNLVTGMIGFAPGSENAIAWEAHIGGFLAGFLCIGWFGGSTNTTALDT